MFPAARSRRLLVVLFAGGLMLISITAWKSGSGASTTSEWTAGRSAARPSAVVTRPPRSVPSGPSGAVGPSVASTPAVALPTVPPLPPAVASPVAPAGSSGAAAKSRLAALSASRRILVGEFDGSTFPADIDTYTNLVGSKPDLVEWFDSFDEPLFWGNQQAGIDARGVTPIITWSPDSDFSMATLLAGGYDSYLTAQAQSVRAWARPVMIRLFHEMNGNWTSYGWGQVTPAQFVAGWRHVANIFRSAGAANVSWVWCPNIYGFGATVSFDQYYPGDAYVDWTGLDGYNYSTAWRSFGGLFGPSYADITRLTSKPLMVAEWGSTETGGNKAAWITAAFAQLPTAMPRIRAMVAFSAVTDDDFRVNSSAASLAAYRAAVAAIG